MTGPSRTRGPATPAPRPWRRLPLVAWDGPLYCHAPVGDAFDLARLSASSDGSNRWNRPGQATVYLASDPAVALAELARHHPVDGSPAARRLIRLRPGARGLGGLVDLRDAAVLRALGITRPPTVFLDRDRARAVADRVRAEPLHHGLIVPSMAFLDDPERCTIVLFADRVNDLGAWLQPGPDAGRVEIGAA
jgi:RES domain-containing protein